MVGLRYASREQRCFATEVHLSYRRDMGWDHTVGNTIRKAKAYRVTRSTKKIEAPPRDPPGP